MENWDLPTEPEPEDSGKIDFNSFAKRPTEGGDVGIGTAINFRFDHLLHKFGASNIEGMVYFIPGGHGFIIAEPERSWSILMGGYDSLSWVMTEVIIGGAPIVVNQNVNDEGEFQLLFEEMISSVWTHLRMRMNLEFANRVKSIVMDHYKEHFE